MGGAGDAGASRIAIIDDTRMFTQALAALLDDQPEFSVVGMGSTAADAIAIARDLVPDVMLLDYHLPDGPSDELVRTILAHSPRTRIVMLTSDTSASVRTNARASGAHGFITKDQSVDRIVAAVAHAAAPV